ncbi:MAG TPA: hypothetical protein DEB05_14960 [Firmicutes bacterium]|jgi:hypothetical protein|nr:hypothetical protein [Bacillota bacterium]HBT18244.1 hypothetical protein [Bacillota bacterium]
MNRRFRRLLTGGLLGAIASVVVGLGRKRTRTMKRRSFYEKAGYPIRAVIGQLSRVGLLGKWWPSRRRVK